MIMKLNLQRFARLSVDLATYDIADGTHTIKLKAKAKGYKSSDLSSGVEYVKSSASAIIEKGTYVWNDSLNFSTSSIFDVSINFISYETNYIGMITVPDDIRLKYINSDDEDENVYTDGWAYDENKTIEVTSDTAVDEDFYTWFSANTTKQASGETWVLNETEPTFEDLTFGFTSNGTHFKGTYDSGNGDAFMYVKDDGTNVCVYDNVGWYSAPTWSTSPYRTLVLDETPTGNVLTWLQSNGVKQ